MQALVAARNRAQEVATVYAAHLAAAERRLSADRASLRHLRRELSAEAVQQYVNSASGGGVGGVGGLAALVPSASASASASAEQAGGAEVYAAAATGQLDALVTRYDDAEHHVDVQRERVRGELRRAEAALRNVEAAQARAAAAVRDDETLLRSVRGNLALLVRLAAERAATAERRAQIQLVRRAVLGTDVPGVSIRAGEPMVPVAVGSGYADPLRGLSVLVPERIDQGVDYSAVGPIFALGDGVVISTANSGWPAGTYIAYRLTSGPAAGLVVYVAEDVDPMVSVGQLVTPRTVLGVAYEGPNGFETGWANGTVGDTMAMEAAQFDGSNSTAFGLNFSELLQSLGAPGGVMQGPVASGGLPVAWPQW